GRCRPLRCSPPPARRAPSAARMSPPWRPIRDPAAEPPATVTTTAPGRPDVAPWPSSLGLLQPLQPDVHLLDGGLEPRLDLATADLQRGREQAVVHGWLLVHDGRFLGPFLGRELVGEL